MKKEEFRDHIGTVDKDGKRVWVYPVKPKGKLYNMRTVVSFLQIGVLVGLPFIKIGGHQALQLDILGRKLHVFGLMFRPQDAFLLALFLITSVVFIFLFTAIFGRVWCGWLCPQTVFMEMIFRKIEYLIEGDSSQQKLLNKKPWDTNKIFKKLSKHSIFYVVSFLISNIFLSYIIGIDELIKIITDPPSKHLTGLITIIIFSFVFYGVFSWFREQACLIVCPYGRFQSVLQDDSTVVISYDFVRGEPRGKATKKNANVPLGDCVDCKMCVKVCPTGIDIRNGLQMECVNCTACIDSCDHIMKSLNRKPGLIKYASSNMIKGKSGFKITTRVISYFLVFALLLSLNIYFHSSRGQLEFMLSRVPGMLAIQIDDQHLANFYDFKLLNNSNEDKKIEMKVVKPEYAKIQGESVLVVGKDETKSGRFLVVLKNSEAQGKKIDLEVQLFVDGEMVKVLHSNFLGE